MILDIFFIIVNLEVVSGRGLVHKVIIIIVDIEEVCYRPLDLASKTLRGNRIFLLDLQVGGTNFEYNSNTSILPIGPIQSQRILTL